jgi:hypothetical protein
MKKSKSEPKPIYAVYNGKVVSMDYVKDPKQRFSLACYRVRDNPAPGRSSGEGYVVEGSIVYRVSPASKLAKLEQDAAVCERIMRQVADALAALTTAYYNK